MRISRTKLVNLIEFLIAISIMNFLYLTDESANEMCAIINPNLISANPIGR